MATGVSKAKWSSKLHIPDYQKIDLEASLDVSLTYQGKIPVDQILAFPAEPSVILSKFGEPINRLYYGNNLPILLSLISDQDIFGKVKLIYIDPPFATKSVFQSRSQTDAYQDLYRKFGFKTWSCPQSGGRL